jgi:hypothetical protein
LLLIVNAIDRDNITEQERVALSESATSIWGSRQKSWMSWLPRAL